VPSDTIARSVSESAPVVGVLVGNPKPRSRTWKVALRVAETVGDAPPALVIDLADHSSGLLDPANVTMQTLAEQVTRVDILVVASPTFKGSFTGLLKVFLDRLPVDALRDVIAVPVMLGSDPRHSLAPEVFLKPVLVELGASCPTSAVFVLEAEHDAPLLLDAWRHAQLWLQKQWR
jgi:FMN reductase